MNAAGRIGIAAGGIAATGGAIGLGSSRMIDFTDRREQREIAILDTDVRAATDQWNAFDAKLEAEFPGRRLDTPADHARIDQFLADNPPPPWVTVKHEGFTSAHVSAGDITRSEGAWTAPSTGGEEFVYPMGFGALLGGVGAASGLAGLAKTPSALKAAGFAAMTGASLAVGATGIVNGLHTYREGQNAPEKAARALTDSVNGTAK